jgi:hypothetical protein
LICLLPCQPIWMHLALLSGVPFEVHLRYLYALLMTPSCSLWHAATWIYLLTTWCVTSRAIHVMEGDWWTYFRWFSVAIWLTFFQSLFDLQHSLKPHHNHSRDVRFWLPISLQVTLYGPASMQRRRSRSRIQHSQYGIRVRLSWRLSSIRTKTQTVPEGSATPRESSTTKDLDRPSQCPKQAGDKY